ncbi:MAG: sulfatase [Planctomycetes bacterium]|nr:sulfatase [Planctomycetota bacterium]
MSRAATTALLLGLFAACGQGHEDSQEVMTVRRPAVDLLELDGWRSLSADRAEIGVITPSLSQGENSADQRALLVGDGARWEVELPAGTPEGRLVGSFGVHFQATRALARAGLAEARIAWSVTVGAPGSPDARTVSGTHALSARGPSQVHDRTIPMSEWAALDGDGLPAGPGDRVRVEARVLDGAEALGEVRMGFGELRLETARQVARTRASAERPNLVLVVMDTQRADRTTPYGYERPTTPNLERLAARGLVYEQAWSPSSWTWPSTASLLTGLEPGEHGVVDQRTGFLPHALTTVAEALQDAGLTTAAFSGNPLVTEDHNFHQGFEHFRAARTSVKGDRVVPEALAWLEAHRQHRFFLYLHLQDPHLPHDTRPEDLSQFTGSARPLYPPMSMQERAFGLQLRGEEGEEGLPATRAMVPEPMARWFSDAYDACVHTGDHWLGVFLEQLTAWGLDEDTVIVFTADHGEELLEHKNLAHGHELWPELLRVPLIVAGPGIEPGRVRTLVSTRRVAHTLTVLGSASPLGTAADGLLVEPASLAEAPVFLQTLNGFWRGKKDVPLLGLRKERWLLHWAPEGGGPWGGPDAPRVRLFDLEADPGAHVDLAGAAPERAEALRAELERLRASQRPQAAGQGLRAGAGTRAAMEAIGYSGGEQDE